MAKNVTELKVKLDVESKEVVKATGETKHLDEAVKNLQADANKMGQTFSEWGTSLMDINALSELMGKLNDTVKTLTATYAAQEIAEARLGQVMRNTMGATDAEIQSIKDLCSAQQELGVIGDEVQIAGAQELGTYLEKTDSLKRLIPVMNDMVAQQYGLNASQESAVGIATMLGKVMEGQVGALSRYGYSFDEVEEQILKFGTEEEKVIVLSKVVGDSVGGMNEALAQTDSGKMQRMANSIGDIKEQIGQLAAVFAPMLDYITMAGDLAMSVGAISKSFMTGIPAIKAFGVALTANPIGIVITAVAALGAALYALYQNCETFRTAVDDMFGDLTQLAGEIYNELKPALDVVWTVLKAIGKFIASIFVAYLKRLITGFRTLANVLGGILLRAIRKVKEWFSFLSDAITAAWKAVKDFFGIEDESTGATEQHTDAIQDQTEAIENEADAYDKLYTSMQKTMTGSKGDTKKTDKPSAPQGSLKALQEQIQALQASVELEVDPTKRAILYNELDKLKKEKIRIEATLKLQTDTQKLKSIMPGEKDLPDVTKGLQLKGVEQFKQQYKEMEAAQRDMAKNQMTVKDNILSTADSFSVMGQAIGGAAGDMMQWAAQSVAAIMQVIPQIVTLMTAKQAEGMAGATASGASLPFPANIAAIAAGVATVVATFAKMPKFANGGIISGPTIGLMGEYSGASNNPEVVAPLNKLKSLLGDTSTVGGSVEFHLQGRQLVGLLARENSIRSRS